MESACSKLKRSMNNSENPDDEKRTVSALHSVYRAKVLWILVALALFVWINNSSLFLKRNDECPTLLAHRGLAQTFDIEGVTGDTNTARIIHDPEHPYLENTLSSIQAAFRCGADIVEFDVRPTKDKKLAVFHDFLLDYRTDGNGNVSDHTMEELKKLDLGYGYTADGGETFPFRGRGVGMLPSIDEVFEAFPDRELLVHIKDGGEEAGRLLGTYLQEMDDEQRKKISVYGDEGAILFLRGEYPQMKVLTRSIMVEAFFTYELVGWTGYVPKAIRNIELHMPLNYAKLLWGWPDRFLQRMERVGSRFVLVNGRGGFSRGFDDQQDLEKIPDNYSGCIWTNRIDKIGPGFSSATQI
jgi:glycerophosphoryl diester phosphodiesterase